MKVLVAYPPGRAYQRGEDRSQGNLDNAVATTIRAPNDLGYVSAILREHGHDVVVRDYQTENLSQHKLMSDIIKFDPELVFLSVTNSTIYEDLEICREIKRTKSSVVIILKGAIFFDADDEIFKQLDLDSADFLIGGEVEFCISEIVNGLSEGKTDFSDVDGIYFRNSGIWQGTSFSEWSQNLDELPFPDRSQMNNKLYVRPDTGEPMATIATSRGCSAKCTYCLTPVISGTKIRYRSPENIFEEINECFHKYGIRNFFFKSDTFTMNKFWVEKLCKYIIGSDLAGEISWVANSRVNPLAQETLYIMKEAGCWLVAFGFESGSEETLLRIKKGANVDHNLAARQMTKKAGLSCFGFFLVGLPWEDESHLSDTKRHIYDLDCEFLELHLAVPYTGTQLYTEMSSKGLIEDSPLGKDYFNAPTKGTEHLSADYLERYRKSLLLRYHIRPNYVIRKLRHGMSDIRILRNYSKFGSRLLKNIVVG